MTVLKNVTHSTEMFTFVKKTNTLVAEASDFMGGPFDDRIYDDAADAGFWLVSHVTGREKSFVNDGIMRDGEGDVTGWKYREINQNGRPVAGGLKVIIFND